MSAPLTITYGKNYYVDILPQSFFRKECVEEEKEHKIKYGTKEEWLVECTLTVQGKWAMLDYLDCDPKDDLIRGVLYIEFKDKSRREMKEYNFFTEKQIEKNENNIYAKEGERYASVLERLTRCSKLASGRKELDPHKCQACGYRLEVNSRYVLDCHHWDEFSKKTKINSVDGLITLCPNCHRIAHLIKRTRQSKSVEDEIKRIQKNIPKKYMHN